jgi:hypothetical protein
MVSLFRHLVGDTLKDSDSLLEGVACRLVFWVLSMVLCEIGFCQSPKEREIARHFSQGF